MAKTLQLQCLHCGTAFLAGNTSAKWCSVSCRKRAFRRRHSPIQARRDREIIHSDSSYALDPQLPLQWQQQADPGHDCRIWHGTAIQRRQSDGYVNATAMCQANGKHLPHYMANDRTKEYIRALAAVVGIPTAAVTHTIQGGTPALQGTWIHPRLAVDLARWISPAFAVWMDGWFLESLQPSSQPPQLPAQLSFGIHIVGRSRRECFHMISSYVRKEVISILNVTDRDLFGTIPNTPAPDYLHYPQRSHTD